MKRRNFIKLAVGAVVGVVAGPKVLPTTPTAVAVSPLPPLNEFTWLGTPLSVYEEIPSNMMTGMRGVPFIVNNVGNYFGLHRDTWSPPRILVDRVPDPVDNPD